MKINILDKINSAARYTLFTVLLLTFALSSRAQLNPFESMYFQNRYIYNPAMAGYNGGLNINADYMQQWSEFPGTPKTTLITADLQATDKVGVGIDFTDDQAGLIRTTNVLATYAYHLPLSDRNQSLSFGVSLGANDSRVNYSAINGDPTDAEIALYNQQKPYFDGDFGVAYNDEDFYLGAAVPDLKSAFFNTGNQSYNADRLLFIAVTSYKIPLQSEDRSFELEPLVAFRKVEGYTSIFDIGLNFDLKYYGFYMQTIYHTSQSVSAGFGLDRKSYAVTFSYDFVTSQLSNYTNGTIEVGMQLRLFNKKRTND
jgi:type IX secretion system PorP/SprF family membrane protein